VSGKHVDGIYTAGTMGGQAQQVYELIVNNYGRGFATPRRLQLPSSAIPSVIAAARNANGSTDFRAVGNTTLYRFPANEQDEDDYAPAAVVPRTYLVGTSTLRAMTHKGARRCGAGTQAIKFTTSPSSQATSTTPARGATSF
jgi:hypothetical protein